MQNQVIGTGYPTPNGRSLVTQAFLPSNVRTDRDLAKFLKSRGMNEKFSAMETILAPTPKLPSQWYQEGDIPQTLHAAMWLSMVAVKAGTATGWELLWDNGVLHSLAHLNLPQSIIDQQPPEEIKQMRTDILAQLLDLEARTPGFQRESK